jgi:hypothetical protein
MRVILTIVALGMLTACTGSTNHYSTYDVNRDGVMDFVCPGMEYDPTRHKHYSWRSKASGDCRDQG